MKLRVVSKGEHLLLYCSDQTILKIDDDTLRLLFIGYKNESSFSGQDGKWDEYENIEDAPGKTLAYVNDNDELCIVDANPFYKLISSVGNSEYITLKEYAEMHSKGEARIKVLCKNQQLAGAVRKGGCWFIPINAPYPQDGRKSNK